MDFGKALLVLECHTGSDTFISTYWQSTSTASEFLYVSEQIMSSNADVLAGHEEKGLQSCELWTLLNESKDNKELFDSQYYFLRLEEDSRVFAWQPLPSPSSSDTTDRYVGYIVPYFDPMTTLIDQTAIDSEAILQNLDTVMFFAQKYGKG